MYVCSVYAHIVVKGHILITQNVKKKRHELQRAYDAASRAAGPEDKTDQHTPIHSPLHSHSATELHRSPVGHVKRQTLKSSSATNLATTTTAGVTMARPPPAVSSAGLRSHLPHRTNDQISINKVCINLNLCIFNCWFLYIFILCNYMYLYIYHIFTGISDSSYYPTSSSCTYTKITTNFW